MDKKRFTNGYISKLGYDPDNPLFAFPTEANGSSSTYIPDFNYESSGKKLPFWWSL